MNDELSPAELLYQQLLAEAERTAIHPKRLTEAEEAHAVSNRLPMFYAFLDSPNSLFRDMMELEAQQKGFASAGDMKTALDEIRERVKEVLPEQEWNTYFVKDQTAE